MKIFKIALLNLKVFYTKTHWKLKISIRNCINKLAIKDNKGIVHPRMEISPWFTHTEAILGVYDILLSDEYNQSYIKNFPGSSKL